MKQYTDIKNFTYDELKKKLLEYGFKGFRAGQICQWVYQKGVFDFNKMSNISKQDREKLSYLFSIDFPEIAYILKSSDETVKFALKLQDGYLIESVLIPDGKRITICVSTQVGCKMGCKFCFTAKMGFKRNLEVSEIIDQILVGKFLINNGTNITNIVFMGMGEPFDNFENLNKSLKIILDERCLNFSQRKVTVSTCGIIDKMNIFGKEFDINLAVSLHSAFDNKRSELMPINKLYSLERLIDACKNYPLRNRQRITFEYIMIKGFNDSLKDAKKLVSLLGDLKSKVNLIRFNAFPDSKYEPSDYDTIEQFQRFIISKGIATILRKSKGEDILAACGQLAVKEKLLNS